MKACKNVILSVLAKDLFDACRAKEIPHPWVQGIRDDNIRTMRQFLAPISVTPPHESIMGAFPRAPPALDRTLGKDQ